MKIYSVSCVASALAVLLLATPALAGGDPDYRYHGNGHSYESYKGGYSYHQPAPRYAPVHQYTGATTYTTYPPVPTYSYTYTYPTHDYGTAYVGTSYPSHGYAYRGCRRKARRRCNCWR